MSVEYNKYLTEHKKNVAKAFYWIRDNLPELVEDCDELEKQICQDHDMSKYNDDEYKAYDNWFYGNNKSFDVRKDYRKAWLTHIHRNPHHWQHWVLISDDEGTEKIEMPYNYIIEMICDWWSFSWAKGDLKEIFDYYDKHQGSYKMHPNTRRTVKMVLNKLEIALIKLEKEQQQC